METEFQDGDYESVTGSDDEEEDKRKSSVPSKNSDTLSKVHLFFDMLGGFFS